MCLISIFLCLFACILALPFPTPFRDKHSHQLYISSMSFRVPSLYTLSCSLPAGTCRYLTPLVLWWQRQCQNFRFSSVAALHAVLPSSPPFVSDQWHGAMTWSNWAGPAGHCLGWNLLVALGISGGILKSQLLSLLLPYTPEVEPCNGWLILSDLAAGGCPAL